MILTFNNGLLQIAVFKAAGLKKYFFEKRLKKIYLSSVK